MTRRRIIASFLCVLLLLTCAVSAINTGSANGNGTTLRVSTATAGSPLVQAAADAPGAPGQPSWIGLFVLVFGGLLTALWLAVAALSFAWTIDGEMRSSTRDESRAPPNRKRSESVQVRWRPEP